MSVIAGTTKVLQAPVHNAQTGAHITSSATMVCKVRLEQAGNADDGKYWDEDSSTWQTDPVAWPSATYDGHGDWRYTLPAVATTNRAGGKLWFDFIDNIGDPAAATTASGWGEHTIETVAVTTVLPAATSAQLDLIEFIRSKLGDPIVDVELDSDQITKCINHALKRWGRRFPTEQITNIQVSSGVNKYDLGILIAADLRGVLEIEPEPLDSDIFDAIEFDIFRDRVYAIPALDLADIALEDVFLEDLRYVSSTMFEWEYNEATRLLFLSPSPSRAYRLMVRYTGNPTLEEATRQYDWVIEYALAEAKETLGLIRRKHGDKIPGKEFEIGLDGASLVQEGKEEQDRLMEQLENIGGDWTPPLVG